MNWSGWDCWAAVPAGDAAGEKRDVLPLEKDPINTPPIFSDEVFFNGSYVL